MRLFSLVEMFFAVLQQESRKLMHDLQRRLGEEEKAHKNGGSNDGDVARLDALCAVLNY